MRLFLFSIVFLLGFSGLASGLTIKDLLDAVEKQPGYQVTKFSTEEAAT
jgi:hypothetical protein